MYISTHYVKTKFAKACFIIDSINFILCNYKAHAHKHYDNIDIIILVKVDS